MAQTLGFDTHSLGFLAKHHRVLPLLSGSRQQDHQQNGNRHRNQRFPHIVFHS
jgi:hypothetical protein